MISVSTYGEVTRFDLARTLLGRGRYWTTAYLVDGLMIDTGCAFTQDELARELAGARVERIVNTHTHEDHIGGNGALQRQFGSVEILAHPLALPVLGDPHTEQPLHPYRRVMWGWPEPCEAKALAHGEVIETERYRFEVIFTPGHSDDHLCLWEPDQGWLFTGDLFVGGLDRALRQDSDVWRIIESLKRLRSLPATMLFPGCAKVRNSPAEAIQIKIDHYEGLGEQVLALHQKGHSVRRIVRELCGAWMWIELITLNHFARQHLVRSYLDNHHQPHRSAEQTTT